MWGVEYMSGLGGLKRVGHPRLENVLMYFSGVAQARRGLADESSAPEPAPFSSTTYTQTYFYLSRHVQRHTASYIYFLFIFSPHYEKKQQKKQ